MTADIAGPMAFSCISRMRFFSVALHGVGASSRSRLIAAICSWTIARREISRAISALSRGGNGRPSPVVNLQTGWVHDQAFDAARHEEARQPECIVSNLIAERDRRWRLAGRLGTAIARDQELCQQACGICAL